mgnify:CR=1 FL=1
MIHRLLHSSHSPGRRNLAALLAMAVVWIGALHFSPTAHAAVHDDAGEADHHCVVEVFNEGVLIATPDVGVHAPGERLITIPVTGQSLDLESPQRLRPPGRAPPIG